MEIKHTVYDILVSHIPANTSRKSLTIIQNLIFGILTTFCKQLLSSLFMIRRKINQVIFGFLLLKCSMFFPQN